MKIRNWKLKILFIIFIFSFLFFNLATKVAYGQTLSLGLYPPLLEVMMQPGKSITQVYKLTNVGETDLAFASKLIPFEPADEFGSVNLQSSIENHQFLSWFSFQNADLDLGQRFIIKSGGEQEVVLKIKVPQNALEDDYYLVLLFETIPDVFLGQSGAQAQAKIGANILLTVSKDGRPPKKAEIIEFRTPKIIDSFDKPKFTLRIKNTGRAFFKPMGTITTTGWLGQEFLLNLLPENVLVNSVRQIQCQIDDQAGPCQVSSRFLLGRYKAKVEFGPDSLTGDYRAETTFFALPIKLILGLIVVSAIIWFVKPRLKT